MWVRRVRCHVCGGPKVTPSRTAFDYCSWCGTLTDWNHQVAYETRGSAQPGPQYQALKLYLTPGIEAARRRGDRAALEDAYGRLYAQHIADCPAAYSPRVGDPDYRRAITAYHAASDAARVLDAGCTALEEAMNRVARTMFWVQRPEGRVVRPDRFFAVHAAYVPYQARVDEVLAASGALARHPDAPPAALLAKIARSAFVQSWLPALDGETGERALAATGLAAEYEEVAPVALDRRACAHCGARLAVAHGARCVLCEQCGALLDAAHVDVPCGGCGAAVTPPAGATQFACPYCRAVLQLIRR